MGQHVGAWEQEQAHALDMGVAAGTFDALYQLRMPNHPLVDWRYYSGKCGNILITKRPFVI